MTDPAHNKRRVRSTALWVGLAAAIMLFFGYRGDWSLPEESISRKGTILFMYTLRIGGWVMLAETLWLLTGARAALLCDGLVTMLIGSVLVIGGLMMTPGSIGRASLFILFGLLFIHSGLRSWRDARAFAPPSSGAPSADRAESTTPTEPAPPPPDPPTPAGADAPGRQDSSGPGGTEQGP